MLATSGTKGDATLPTSDDQLDALIQHETGEYKYSVEDFFRKAQVTSISLSPNGKYLAYLAPYQRRQNLHVRSTESAERVARITNVSRRDIQGFFWANDDRLCYIQDEGGDENFKLYAVDRDGGNPKDLTPFDDVRIQIIDALRDDDEHVIIGMNRDNKQLFAPYRLNVVNGELTQLATNDDVSSPLGGWQTDHDGRLRLAYRVTNGVEIELLLREQEDDDWTISLTTDWKSSVSPLFFDFEDPNVVYALSNIGRDKAAAVRLNLSSGENVEIVYSNDDVDVSGIGYSRKRRKITSIHFTTDRRQRIFKDKRTEQLYGDLHDRLGDSEVVIASRNLDETVFIVRTYSDRTLGNYYLYIPAEERLDLIGEVSPWLDKSDLVEMQSVTITARDGLELPGYLTLPNNTEKPYPAIILPHGGPSSRDSWGYRPDIQLLASRGYAVLQINFRGSTGYGKEFWTAGFKEWGKAMQDDLSDGVQWLIDEGYASADRIGIYGGSYGGYAVLAGLAFTPDLYACGIDYVGVSNIFTILENIPPYWEPYRAMMYEQIGDPNDPDDIAYMKERSPALHADKIVKPLLVVQGANDPRVKIQESDQMVSAMRERGVDVPYMVKYNEGHGYSNEENQFHFYKVMLGFLAKYLKN